MPPKKAKSKAAKRTKKQEKVQKKQQKQDQPQPQINVQNIKAKKYSKNYQQLQRINRSKFQRIYLITAQRKQQHWEFTVLGTTGSKYKVIAGTQMKCSCTDFRIKKKPCKHLYFIATQVAQNEELTDYFKQKPNISKNAYKILDSQLTKRLRARMATDDSKDKKDIDLKDDKDCTICFTEMDKQNQKLEDCGTCKKYFHTQCISVWKNHNPTCPLCRGPLKGSPKDAMGKVQQIKV